MRPSDWLFHVTRGCIEIGYSQPVHAIVFCPKETWEADLFEGPGEYPPIEIPHDLIAELSSEMLNLFVPDNEYEPRNTTIVRLLAHGATTDKAFSARVEREIAEAFDYEE